MRNHSLASLLLVLFAAGCQSTPAAEGFQLAFQLQNVSSASVEMMRVTISPRTDSGPAAFEEIPTTSYEDGAVTVDVDDTGVLVMTITGDYVRSHIVNDDALNPRFVLEVWSDDEAMRMGPQVRGTVIKAGEQIATGQAYLPMWPLALGATTQINVPCGPTFTAQCAAP